MGEGRRRREGPANLEKSLNVSASWRMFDDLVVMSSK
jgi:hypothetical protein